MTNDENTAYASMSWLRFSNEVTDDLARAVVSAFALVAVADGDLAEAEIDSFVTLIYEREDVLSSLDFARYEPLFREISGALFTDPESGRSQALELISAVRSEQDHCELVISAAQIALMADNKEEESETKVLSLIRGALEQS